MSTISQSINWSFSQSISRSVSEQSASQSVSLSVSQPISQLVSQSVRQPVSQSIIPSIHLYIKREFFFVLDYQILPQNGCDVNISTLFCCCHILHMDPVHNEACPRHH